MFTDTNKVADAFTEMHSVPKETIFMNIFGGVIDILYFHVRLCGYGQPVMS